MQSCQSVHHDNTLNDTYRIEIEDIVQITCTHMVYCNVEYRVIACKVLQLFIHLHMLSIGHGYGHFQVIHNKLEQCTLLFKVGITGQPI